MTNNDAAETAQTQAERAFDRRIAEYQRRYRQRVAAVCIAAVCTGLLIFASCVEKTS